MQHFMDWCDSTSLWIYRIRPISGATHVVDDPLDKVVLSLQRWVQQQRQRVELYTNAVVGPLRAGFTEDGLLTLRERTEVKWGNKDIFLVYFLNW